MEAHECNTQGESKYPLCSLTLLHDFFVQIVLINLGVDIHGLLDAHVVDGFEQLVDSAFVLIADDNRQESFGDSGIDIVHNLGVGLGIIAGHQDKRV